MSFSIMVWNVERFQATSTQRIRRVADHILGQDPDVLCILEFMGKSGANDPSSSRGEARRLISEFLTDYDFGLTDSRQRLEILTGWKRNTFAQVLYTQRREFDAQNPYLRPGGLLSLREDGDNRFTNLLFLHTDSGREAQDYTNRQEMFRRTWNLKAALEQLPIQNNAARFIALGDLNTMGRRAVGNQPSISKTREVNQLALDAQTHGMRMLSKSHDRTWSRPSGTGQSNLDHVLASDDLQFQQWYYASDPSHMFEVDVRGWNELSGQARRSFIQTVSDHCSLWAQVV